jgi:hypothetical protein
MPTSRVQVPDALVPRFSTLRLSIVPALAWLNSAHSCHAWFASALPYEDFQVVVCEDREG